MTDELRQDLRRIVARILSASLCHSDDLWSLSDDDIDSGVLRAGRPQSQAIEAGVDAIMLIVHAESERAAGELLDRLRVAEGVDFAVIDAAFGVDPEDL